MSNKLLMFLELSDMLHVFLSDSSFFHIEFDEHFVPPQELLRRRAVRTKIGADTRKKGAPKD